MVGGSGCDVTADIISRMFHYRPPPVLMNEEFLVPDIDRISAYICDIVERRR